MKKITNKILVDCTVEMQALTVGNEVHTYILVSTENLLTRFIPPNLAAIILGRTQAWVDWCPRSFRVVLELPATTRPPKIVTSRQALDYSSLFRLSFAQPSQNASIVGEIQIPLVELVKIISEGRTDGCSPKEYLVNINKGVNRKLLCEILLSQCSV